MICKFSCCSSVFVCQRSGNCIDSVIPLTYIIMIYNFSCSKKSLHMIVNFFFRVGWTISTGLVVFLLPWVVAFDFFSFMLCTMYPLLMLLLSVQSHKPRILRTQRSYCSFTHRHVSVYHIWRVSIFFWTTIKGCKQFKWSLPYVRTVIVYRYKISYPQTYVSFFILYL